MYRPSVAPSFQKRLANSLARIGAATSAILSIFVTHIAHGYDTITHKKMGEIALEHFEKNLLARTTEFPSIGTLMNAQRLTIEKSLRDEFVLWLEKEDTEGLIPANAQYHFWDPSSNKGLYDFDTALMKAQAFWDRALWEYFHGHPIAAFENLGRVCHLIGDAACPAHTLLDPHYDPSASPIADPDIDTLHTFAALDAVLSDKTIHWPGGEIKRNQIEIENLMKAVASKSSDWDSDDANGKSGGSGRGNLNGNKWYITSRTPWFISTWKASGLEHFTNELQKWIFRDAFGELNLEDAGDRLVGYLLDEIPIEILNEVSGKFNYKLSEYQVTEIIGALQRTIYGAEQQSEGARRAIYDYELKDPTVRWAASTVDRWSVAQVAIDLYDLALKTDLQLFERKKLGILLERFPNGLSKKLIDTGMLAPISDADLRRIAKANVPLAEENIAKAVRLFFDSLRPKIVLLKEPETKVETSGEVTVDLEVKLLSGYMVPTQPFITSGLSQLKVKTSQISGVKIHDDIINIPVLVALTLSSIDKLPLRLPSFWFNGTINTLEISVVDSKGVESYPISLPINVPKDSAGPMVKNNRP